MITKSEGKVTMSSATETLNAIFEKPVGRPIEGVIKADDEASLRLELDEYVLTNEVEKRLESFLSAYNGYEGANGVWVSGFFGSGKSHLLKMLAMLLENREVEGRQAIELFLPKCEGNTFLQAELRKAVAIPSKSILFNIDQKADIISKTEFDALLSVFVKVFNEMRGYYGKQGHIAQFERDLDERGLYDDFRAQYQAIAGRSWERGREQALLEVKNIAAAHAAVTDQADRSEAAGILEKYRQAYRVSIEDFAKEVEAYISQQAEGFRLNFFVDEVGQYIAEHVKLMTNLQTIAESLATKCKGRAWIIVTAQEDMDTVLGEMKSRQANDFSKIQARFANRMKLTSQDVSEVIQKRLLMKNDVGVALLEKTYAQQSNNFKTQFDFADGSATYRNFKDREHFILSYPFIPYQFSLFQTAIQRLSQHNAFEGKHSSVGERSMLGVFQEVAIKISDRPVGELATFDLMYQGIRSTLKSGIQSSILMAERQLADGSEDKDFAVRLLKTLFLVKYVKEFKATVRNLCVLMTESFETDISWLGDHVQEALSLLEQQTYIQRNGDLYEYLTDEEKDIEEEIKSTEVENSVVVKALETLIFDFVIKERKIRYSENKQDYLFSRKLDGQLAGREHELAINVITPFNDHSEDEALLKMQSLGLDELRVVMPSDDRLMRDLSMYVRTEKYRQQNTSLAQQEATQRILADKAFQNAERYRELQSRVKALLGRAKLYISGSEIEVGGENAQNRIITGFHGLIGQVYANLRMLRGVTYREEDIGNYLDNSQKGLFGSDVTALAEAEQEVLAFIQSNHRGGIRTTLKALLERFERKPYGWYYAAILCTAAKLCASGKVEVRSDGNLLEADELKKALRNSREHGNVLLEPQVDFSPSQVRRLKEFYEDFFDGPPEAGEAKAVGQKTGLAFKELRETLSLIMAQSAQYPFLNALTPVIEKLRALSGKPYTWYLTELMEQADELLVLKEQAIDPIRRFMSGAQKGIYDEAQAFKQAQKANASYVEGDEWTQMEAVLVDPQCFKGGRIQQLKGLVESLKGAVQAKTEAEIASAKDEMAVLKGRLGNMPEFSAISAEQQGQITQVFDDFETGLEQHSLIAVINDKLRRFRETDYPQQLSQMTAWAEPKPELVSRPKPSDETGEETSVERKPLDYKDAVDVKPKVVVADQTIKFVSYRSITVDFDKAWLADETDVDGYLASIRRALIAEIQSGKRIQI